MANSSFKSFLTETIGLKTLFITGVVLVGLILGGSIVAVALVNSSNESNSVSPESTPVITNSSTPTASQTPINSDSPATPEVSENKSSTGNNNSRTNPVQQPNSPAEPAAPAGPTQQEIAAVQAEREYYQLEIINSQARLATLQGDLDLQTYFLSVAVAYSDNLKASEVRGNIARINANIANENAYLNMITAQMNSLPNY